MLLENDFIRLRAVEPHDADIMWLAEADSDQWIQNSMSAPLSRRNILNYALTYDADPMRSGQLRLMIERKSDPTEIVGIIDLYDISPIHRHAFVGIYIFPPFRLNNFARKALLLLEEYCFNLLNITHLAAKIMEHNEASVSLFESSNYQLRGAIPNWLHANGDSHSLLLYSKILQQQ